MTWAVLYWAGDAWSSVPSEALAGSYTGGCEVAYAVASDFGLDGGPCGAVGRPEIVLRSSWMTGAGMDWWLDWLRTLDGILESAGIDLAVFDRRYGQPMAYHGTLLQPQGTAHMGASGVYTTYSNVLIRIVDCVASSH